MSNHRPAEDPPGYGPQRDSNAWLADQVADEAEDRSPGPGAAAVRPQRQLSPGRRRAWLVINAIVVLVVAVIALNLADDWRCSAPDPDVRKWCGLGQIQAVILVVSAATALTFGNLIAWLRWDKRRHRPQPD